MNKLVLSPRLYFSYRQFHISDKNVRFSGCTWTEEHSAQGFARHNSAVNFGTILEFGEADVTVNQSEYKPSDQYERVIAVPFLVTSGTINIEGPESNEPRSFSLAPGNYRLVAAQRVLGDDEEAIDLFFERLEVLPAKSEIIKKDDALNPPTRLIETAMIAGDN
jgi:hypothetical protein